MGARTARAGSELLVRIEGYDMPGRSCAPADAGERYENVHVGIQRLGEVVDLVAADAPDPIWSFGVTVRSPGEPDTADFRGPFVHGRRGDRFLYLSWGTVDRSGGEFRMFRRAKLHFADCGANVIEAAVRHGRLRGRVRMSDDCGLPRCARVRPPDVEWTADSP